MASISTRLYIRWPPEEAKEPTSTLVLTTPTNTYVDLRFCKPMPTHPAATGILQWGFAGVAYKHGNHGRWVHSVDSNFDVPFEDSGIMEQLANGDVLERGQMLHPDESVVRKYEEAWRDHKVFPKVAVVLELDLEETGSNGQVGVFTRGVVVRVGRWCQGIMRLGDEVTAERWCFENGHWKRVCRVGRGHLPCSVACLGEYEPGPALRWVPDVEEVSDCEKENVGGDEELPGEVLAAPLQPEQKEKDGEIWINEEKDTEDEKAARYDAGQQAANYNQSEQQYQDHPDRRILINMKVEVGNQISCGDYVWKVMEKTEW